MTENGSESAKSYHDIYLDYIFSAVAHVQNISSTYNGTEGHQTTFAEVEKTALLSILTDMIHQVGILSGGAVLNTSPTKITVKPPMATRFASHIKMDLYEEQTLRPFHEALHNICDTKLENDLFNLRDLLRQCVNEIRTNGTFTVLNNTVNRRNNDAYEEYQLIDEYVRSSAKFAELSLKQEKLMSIDQRLKDHLEMYQIECDERRVDLKCTHEMEQRMVRRWEDSRLEQMTDVFKCELVRLDAVTMDLCQKCSDDMLTIERLSVYNKCKYARIENAIKYWIERCADEKSTLGEEIKTTKDCIKCVWTEYETLRDSYRERDAFIENYRVEQKQLQAQREHEMKQRQAAVNIQAWWRGTMVRKCLGPYRPKKKKGKKGGK